MRISRRRSPRSLWAYAYLILPPQRRNRLTTIRVLIEGEIAAARGEGRIWAGRMVLERRITHLLIVSDDPGQKRGINRRLALELKRLKAEYFLTRPMAIHGGVDEDAAPPSAVSNGH